MTQQLDEDARRVLSGLGHSTDDKKEQPKVQQPKQQAQPKVNSAPKEEEKPKDNLVLRQLKDAFGVEKLKTEDVVINDITFTLKALTSRWVAWADSMALQSLIRNDGTYSIPEYQTRLEIFLAGVCVEAINGESLQTVFENNDIRLAKAKFIDFLLDESKDGLAKQIWQEYSDKVEEKAKIITATNLNAVTNMQTFKCPVCNNIEAYEKRTNPYYCHKDGAKLEVYELETASPLFYQP